MNTELYNSAEYGNISELTMEEQQEWTSYCQCNDNLLNEDYDDWVTQQEAEAKAQLEGRG